MAKITYITSDNQTHTVEVQNGLTVMEELFKMIFLVSMQIVVEGWRVQPAMFMSKMIGLIKFQKKKMEKMIC